MRSLGKRDGFASIKLVSRECAFMDITSLIGCDAPSGSETAFCLKGYTIPDVIQILPVCQGGLSSVP